MSALTLGLGSWVPLLGSFDLRLDGISIIRQNMFIGQHLRLSGVAFLWYRLHEPNGTLILARAVRRISAPIEVDLRGTAADGDFWSPPG